MSSYSRTIRIWGPALLWLLVIALESFRLSGSVTGAWLQAFLGVLHVPVSQPQLQILNHVVRKTGHFVGYGMLTALFYRAFFESFRARTGPLRVLRLRSAALALAVTMVTASLDEWHQSFDRRRTGTSSDVVLDMVGGLSTQMLILGVGLARRHERQASRLSHASAE